MFDTESLIHEIISAINVATDLNSNQIDRNNANKFIKEVKENLSNYFEKNINVSIKLLCFVPENFTLNNENLLNNITLSNIHNFGFQLLEVLVKCNWNKLNDTCKNELKLLMLNFICRQNLQETVLYCVYNNTLLKDQFSKLLVEILIREWPQNWPDFLIICLNQKENELVLYTLWRLSENLGIFYLPSNPKRRRELNVTIKNEFQKITIYLQSCFIIENLNLSILSLKTLNSFFEWCSIDKQFLTFLCKIYSLRFEDTDKVLKIFNCTSDCLLTCLNRKVFKTDEKLVFLELFDETNISFLIDFLKIFLSNFNQKIESKIIDEQNINLIKKICNIFSLMGQTICSLSTQLPNTWLIYLEIMLQMFQDNNQIYNYYALQFWKKFFKMELNPSFSLDEEFILNIIKTIPNKMVKKLQFENIFLLYEFDELDYETFFCKFKSELEEFLKLLIKENDKICIQFSFNLAKEAFEYNNLINTKCEIATNFLNLVFYNLQDENLNLFSEEALLIFNYILNNSNISDPELLSTLLSALSALSVFLKTSVNKNELFKQLISKLFDILQNPDFSLNDTKLKPIVSLRRHACVLFIKLCIKNDIYLLPFFDIIFDYVKKLNEKNILSNSEKSFFYEGLIILSNHFTNQHEFVKEILSQISWLLEYKQTCSEFMFYIGLTSPVEEWKNFFENKSNLSFAINLFILILNRISKQNISLFKIFEYVYSLTNLISNLNEMWKPEYQQICYSNYRNEIYYPIQENEKKILLENHYMMVKKEEMNDLNRMSNFIWLLHENCYNALGCLIKKFINEFYHNLDFVLTLKHIDYLPNFKLKMILRLFIKPLLNNCPNDTNIKEKKIYPFLLEIIPFFFKRIDESFEKIRQSQLIEDNLTDNDKIEDEVLQKEIARSLTKEFMDVLELIFILQSNEEKTITSLGLIMIKNIPDIIFIITSLMTCLDSVISFRATTLTLKLIEKIMEENLIQNLHQINLFFNHVLLALGYFGEDDQNQSMLLILFDKIYENYVLKTNHYQIKTNLAQYCGNSVRDWDSFEKNYASCSNVKKKKDGLKKLLNNAIGKNLSQLYKINKEEIKNLDPIFKQRKESLDIGECKIWQLFEST